MGIDHIFIDESHQFKNLTFNTRHDRVAGLGNPEGSQKALNMLFAIRTIQERTGKDFKDVPIRHDHQQLAGRNCTCSSSTCARRNWNGRDIRCLDAWAAIFAKKTTDFEFNVTNNVVQKGAFPLLHQSAGACRLLQRDNRLPHGRGCGCGSSAQERYCTIYRPRRSRRTSFKTDAVRQDG